MSFTSVLPSLPRLNKLTFAERIFPDETVCEPSGIAKRTSKRALGAVVGGAVDSGVVVFGGRVVGGVVAGGAVDCGVLAAGADVSGCVVPGRSEEKTGRPPRFSG